MTERPQLKTGDPVMDAAQGRAMIVLGVPDLTVEEWSEENSYDLLDNYGNSKFDPSPEEPVVECVYVSNVKSEPSKTYTFPRSRVRLIDAHHADDGFRVAERIEIETLRKVFDTLAGERTHRARLLAEELDSAGVFDGKEIARVALFESEAATEPEESEE